MPPCGALVIWTSVPVGSKFLLESDGDCGTYDVSALVSMNGSPFPNLEHADICRGTAAIDIDGKSQRWTIEITLIVMNKLSKGVNLEARIEDAAGNVIQVPDGTGGTEPALCQWQSGTSAGSSLEIVINVRSVKS